MPRFCTALHQGQPCTFRALPGQALLLRPPPRARVETRQCEFFNRKGQRCRSTTPCAARAAASLIARATAAPHAPLSPLVPRTRRQRAQAKWLIFINLPQSKMTLLELQPDQALAGAP